MLGLLGSDMVGESFGLMLASVTVGVLVIVDVVAALELS